MTPAEFREQYPEFADEVAYTDAAVTRVLAFAARQLPADRWLDLRDEGLGLFTAHSLTINRRRTLTAAAGVVPGAVFAPIASKSVDKVSVSYDIASVTLADAGYWGQSSYGIQLLAWARMVGAGGVQLR